jgi:hypothetical protein
MRGIWSRDKNLVNFGGSLPKSPAEIPAAGMVGPRYRGTLAILSVNGAGAKDDSKALPRCDRMYEACQRLRASEPSASALQAFEALAQAEMASMPDWE